MRTVPFTMGTAIGNVRFLIDGSGEVKDVYTYDTFGVMIERRQLSSGSMTIVQAGDVVLRPNNYLYCGEQFDPDLGLYYNRARYLSPETGRFWTMDSFEGSQGETFSLHKYLYANADPVNRHDPSGKFSFGESQAAISTGITIQSMVLTAIASTTANLFLWDRGMFSDPSKPQLPDLASAHLTADAHWILIDDSQKTVDEVFQRLLELRVDGSASPSGDVPVSGVGNRIKWTLNPVLRVGQAPFYVTVNKFVNNPGQEGPGDHFFSVVTMGGHPLKGYRFWRVFRTPGNSIEIETGAVDEPARALGVLKRSLLGGHKAVLKLWQSLFEDAVNFSGGDYRGGNIFGGYNDSRKEEFLNLVQ